MIPFQEGRFEITAVATDGVSTATVKRVVHVAESIKTFSPKDGRINPMIPTTRLVVRPEDKISVAFQGAPGGRARFRFTQRGTLYPMREMDGSVEGIYKGTYVVQHNDRFDGSDVIYYLRRRDGKKLSKRAGAKIIVQRRATPRYIETKENVVLLTGPGSDYGYDMFFEPGVQLEVTGEMGEFYRVLLNRVFQGWVKKAVVADLPRGTPRALSVSRNIRVSTGKNSTLLEIPLQHHHAHRVEQMIDPYRLFLTIYGVVPDTDRIRYLSDDSIIKEITWNQDEPNTVTFDIQTTQKYAWGYDVRYEGNTFVLEIRHHPELKGWGNSLKGLRVAVDAGHSLNSFGTIGPWGNTEESVNLMTAKQVKKELEKKGAEVVMIREGEEDISLLDRVKRAWDARADLFISFHCDATGEGNDPRDSQGYSVHYYHPQSRLWAEQIHKLYGTKTKITDQGLWRSNLAVCRATQMPAVLLEEAYLILPEYEELLLTPKFQRTVADVVASSIQSYLKQVKP